MKDFLITLFLGWLGIHRFMKKKYITGVIWLCTFGLFGMGWFVDTVVAFVMMLKGEQQTKVCNLEQNQRNYKNYTVSVKCRMLLKSFDTVIVGTFAKCSLDPDMDREDIVEQIQPKSQLALKHWKYNGEPAYYVMHPNGLDAGNVRAGLAKILYEEYNDCELEVTAISETWDKKNDCPTYNIRIDIYK